MQWYHEDPQALHIGTVPSRNAYTPFAPGEDPFGPRETSSRRISLNGEWDFRYFPALPDLPEDFLTMPMDARMPRESLMYQLFNTNFHEKVRQKKLKKQITTELDGLPDKVREEIKKAPADAEGVFPYPDETFKGEV